MKLKIITLLAILYSFCPSIYGQVTFQKTFGEGGYDNGESVIQTYDSGFVIAGSISDTAAATQGVYLIKTTSAGDTVWTRTILDTAGAYNTYSILETHDHGLVISASINLSGAANYDVYLIRTDSAGNLMWSKTYGGTGIDYGSSVYETTDGKFIITGNTHMGAGLVDIYLVKADSAGTLLWSKTFGQSGNDNAWGIFEDSHGRYVIGGYANGDPFILKTDTSGNLLWAKSYSGSGTDYVYSLNLTADGGYIMSGQTTNVGAGVADLFMAKSDSDGIMQWAMAYGGTHPDDGNTSAVQTNDGGYILCGNTKSFNGGTNYDAYLIKTDSVGNHVWSKTFGATTTDDHSYSLSQTFDNGYILSGSTISYGAGDYDVYLIKTDSDGNSGCNEAVATTIVTPFTLSDSSIHLTVTNPATNTRSPLTITGSGGILNTQCFSLTTGLADLNSDNANFKTYPNPVSDVMHVSFSLSKSENVTIQIFGLDGKLVSTLAQKNFSSGENDFTWNTARLSEGMYFIKLEGINFQLTEKIFVIK